MKKHSVSLLSKAKILISLILAVAVICTMAVSIGAADANVGYQTANATVFTPMDLLKTTTSTNAQSLELKDTLDSSVWKFAVNGAVLGYTEYVKPAMHKDLNNYIKFYSDGVVSTYSFYGNTNAFEFTTYNYTKRAIKFTVGNGEKMTFGFTAPQDGKYEISAPITATGTNVKYAIYKTSADSRVCLQDWQDYTATSAFCNLPVTLYAGDTVWLEATADDGAVIDIGIPRVIKQTENKGITDNGDGSLTYTYNAADYVELAAVNGITYAKAFPATANMTGAWDYGYFKDTVSFGTKASEFKSALGLGAGEIKFNPDRDSSALKDELKAAMQKYELMPYGDRLAAYDLGGTDAPSTVLGANNATVKAAKSVVVPDISSNSFSSNFRASDNTATGTEYTQYGNWFEFVAPVSGSAKLSYPATALANSIVMLIAKNDFIINLTFTTTTDSTTLELGNLAAGDRITILYYAFKSTTKLAAIGYPTITMKGTYNTLKLEALGGGDSYQKYVASGTQVTLPTPKKDGVDFLGWSDGEKTYNGGDVYTVTADTTLTATYQSLESQVDYDLDGDYDVDGADLVILRDYLLENGTIAEDRLPFADKNGKEGIDIRDFVHIRALIAVS